MNNHPSIQRHNTVRLNTVDGLQIVGIILSADNVGITINNANNQVQFFPWTSIDFVEVAN